MKVVLPDTNIILWTFNGGTDFREAIANVAPITVGIVTRKLFQIYFPIGVF